MPEIDRDYRDLLEAASFASRVHRGQTRKDSEQTPYASHPFRVCLIVLDLFEIRERPVLMAALLHDTIEDTATDFDEVAERFGAEVASWVAALSKDKRLPEEEREEAYVRALQESPWQVKICKLADVLDNLWDSGKLQTEKRSEHIRKAERYCEGLRKNAEASLEGPLALVQDAIGAMRRELGL